MKENDKNVDNISFTAEANVVDNMEEESFILEQKKYPLVSLADILTINMNEKGNYPCNKCQYQGSSQRNT